MPLTEARVNSLGPETRLPLASSILCILRVRKPCSLSQTASWPKCRAGRITLKEFSYSGSFFPINMNPARMFRVTTAFSLAIFFYPAGLITERNTPGMFAFEGSLIHAFCDMVGKAFTEIFGEGTQHLGKELSLRGGIIDILTDRDQRDIMLCLRYLKIPTLL